MEENLSDSSDVVSESEQDFCDEAENDKQVSQKRGSHVWDHFVVGYAMKKGIRGKFAMCKYCPT